MKKIIKPILIIIMLTALLTLVSSCNKSKYPRPSKEFYVSDFADALLPGSRQSFILEGERLYENTKEESEGGAQIVVATMMIESEDKIAEIDRTELFRKWRIGENDMGLLILLLFVEEENGDKVLVSSQIEIGYRMEQYVTAARAGYVLDNCLYNPEWEGSIDMGLGEMYYELLTTIYIEAYGYESFNYDMETYRGYLINAEEQDIQVSMSLIAYIFSPYSSVWSKIFTLLPIFLLGGGGLGIFAVRKKGGGGSSGGYGVRR